MESPPPLPALAPSRAPSIDSGGQRHGSSPRSATHTYPSPPLSAVASAAVNPSRPDLSAFLSSPQHSQFSFSLPVPVPVPVPFPMAQHHQHQHPFLYNPNTATAPVLMDPTSMAMAAAAAAAATSGPGWPGTHVHAPPQVAPIPLSPVDLASYQEAIQHQPLQQPLLISPNHLLQGHSPAPDSCVAGNVLGPTAPAASTSASDLNHDRDLEPSSPTPSSSFADRAQTQEPTTKRKPVIAMPDLPSALEKRCKGGPGKKRKGISDEERMARQQDRVARNRIAAQESRNKKRAYVETLEAAAADLQESNAQLVDDNERLRKRLKVLEEDNSALAKKLDWVMAQMAKVSGVQGPEELMGVATPVQVPVPEPVAVAVATQQPVQQPMPVVPVPASSPSTGSDLIPMSLADLTALIADGTSTSPIMQMPSMFDFAALFAPPASTSTSNGQLQAQSAPSASSSSSSASISASSAPSLSSSSSSRSSPSASSTPTPGFPGPAAAGKLRAVAPTACNSQQRRPRGARVFEAPPAMSKMATVTTTLTTTTTSTTLVIQPKAPVDLLPAWDSHWTLALAAMLKLMHWTLALAATTWMRTCSFHNLFDVLVGELTKSGRVSVDVARAIVAGVLQMDAQAVPDVKTVVVQVPRGLVEKLVGAKRKVEGERALAKRWGVYKKRPP